MRILVHAPKLIQPCRAALHSLDVEAIEAAVHGGGARLPADISGVVIEANQPDAGTGFLLAMAVQQKLPVLCLVEKGRPLPEPLDTVRANPTYNRHLKLVRYSEPQVRRRVEQFVACCAGRGPEQPSIKFTLRLTPALDRYITWRASKERIEKAQFLRRFLSDEIVPRDEAYSKFLEGN